jgi:hypothetical protein
MLYKYEGLKISLTFRGKEDYYTRDSYEECRYISHVEMFRLMDEISKTVHTFLSRDRIDDINLSKSHQVRLIERKNDQDSEC